MQTIGRYELIEKLGQGGMGAVYRARDTLLQRIVAVKVIATSIDQNEELRERFFREARAAGQLSHKNIITIHDLGEHEGQPYLAMEYLQGQDLLARMQSPQRMSLRRRIDVAIEICEGLDFAHVHGVVHRDIKPANIFITDSGMVKILDFGLARLVTSELTRSNMMMGTINYMAPEQIRGEKIDHRADIFSSAVVLYELLSGRRAFDADSFAATLYKILQEFPEPLQHIDPTIPSEIVRIVERALSKPRDERYQHMSEMLLDLSVFRQQLAGLDSPAGGRLAPTELRTPSDKPFEVTPPIPLPPVATPLPVTGAPLPVSGPPATSPPAPAGVRSYFLPAIAVLALAIAAIAMWNSSRSQSSPPVSSVATPVPPATPITELTKSAITAFEAEDFATAVRICDAVLLRDPGNDAARQLRDRARAAATAVEEGLRKARTLFAGGQFEDASRAAGEVLGVAPGNKEARQIMEDGATRSHGRGRRRGRQAHNAWPARRTTPRQMQNAKHSACTMPAVSVTPRSSFISRAACTAAPKSPPRTKPRDATPLHAPRVFLRTGRPILPAHCRRHQHRQRQMRGHGRLALNRLRKLRRRRSRRHQRRHRRRPPYPQPRRSRLRQGRRNRAPRKSRRLVTPRFRMCSRGTRQRSSRATSTI